MKVRILEVENSINSKTSLPVYRANVIGYFSSFGKTKLSTVDITLTDYKQYEEFSKLVDKEIDIDVVIPKPTFPLTLNNYKKI